MNRYEDMFARLRRDGSGAFIPFVMLGDPTPSRSTEVIEALLDAGADALELGIPFSDPIADGPTIQAAAQRALAAGVTPGDCFSMIREVRSRHPAVPIGLLVYANLVYTRGIEPFYASAADCGVDSVLVADVPARESAPFSRAASASGVDPVLIAAPNTPDTTLETIARNSSGYTYVVTRSGVTGAGDAGRENQRDLLGRLRAMGAPPAVMGFGISRPRQVRRALQAGAAGAISGSAVVDRLTDALDRGDPSLEAVRAFVGEMKAATHSASSAEG